MPAVTTAFCTCVVRSVRWRATAALRAPSRTASVRVMYCLKTIPNCTIPSSTSIISGRTSANSATD